MDNQLPQPISPLITNSIPTPPPATVPSPPTPIIPPSPPQGAYSSSPPSQNKMPLIIIGIIIILIILGGIIYFFFSSNKETSPLNKIQQTVNPLAKYDIDTDNDFIPDIIETKADLNPNISEITRCQSNGCDASQITKSQNTQKNVLIILDASGSMAEIVSGQSKMDAAKSAITQYISNATGKINIGLMVYGHKGSNSASDKTLSCTSIDTLAEIGSLNSQNVANLLATIKPTGWTAIGSALTKAQTVFSGKEEQTNQIIVVSDGIETCDSNPTGIAAELNSSGLKINVDVIGFALGSSGQEALKAISDSGGGIYSSANSSDELNQQLKTKWENMDNLIKEKICKYKENTAYFTCLNEVLSKSDAVIFGITDTYVNNSISQSEFNYLNNLSEKIQAKYKTLYDTIDSNTDAYIEAKTNILDQQ